MYRIARTLLIVSVSLLVVYGLSMLYSTTYTAWGETLLQKQVIWIALGSVLALICSELLDYHFLGRHSYLLIFMFIAMLSYLGLINVISHFSLLPEDIIELAPFVGGLSKGSARWFNFGYFSVQPSEFAKLAIVIFMANYFMRHARHTDEFIRGFLKPLSTVGVLIFLILAGGDFSTTAIIGTVVFALAFVSGIRIRYLVLVVLGGLLVATTAIVTNPERISRITAYTHPEKYQQDESYQLWYSQLALGSGGWTGMGFTESRMKHFYLPEAHTDFIVAIIGEEVGFLGILFLMLLYIILLISAFWIAFLAIDREGTILAIGLGLTLGFHAFVNLSVVSGFCPTTGVTAPFVSYGGSNMIASMVSVGLMLNICRIAEKKAKEEEMNTPQARKREPLYKQRLNLKNH